MVLFIEIEILAFSPPITGKQDKIVSAKFHAFFHSVTISP